MSWHGKQFKGAQAARRAEKRDEAIARQKPVGDRKPLTAQQRAKGKMRAARYRIARREGGS